MTSDDFRAWLSGFSEAVDGTPTEAQWARILEKLGHVVPVAPIIPADLPKANVARPHWHTGNPPPHNWPYPFTTSSVGTLTNGTRVVDVVSGRDLGGAP